MLLLKPSAIPAPGAEHHNDAIPHALVRKPVDSQPKNKNSDPTFSAVVAAAAAIAASPVAPDAAAAAICDSGAGCVSITTARFLMNWCENQF